MWRDSLDPPSRTLVLLACARPLGDSGCRRTFGLVSCFRHTGEGTLVGDVLMLTVHRAPC